MDLVCLHDGNLSLTEHMCRRWHRHRVSCCHLRPSFGSATVIIVCCCYRRRRLSAPARECLVDPIDTRQPCLVVPTPDYSVPSRSVPLVAHPRAFLPARVDPVGLSTLACQPVTTPVHTQIKRLDQPSKSANTVQICDTNLVVSSPLRRFKTYQYRQRQP
jgi:hypothetical protein